MKDHSECKRGFYHVSKSSYADGKTWKNEEFDEITMGFYHPDGGTTGEFSIVWRMLGGEAVPQLRAFDDSWSALLGFEDLLEKLADQDGRAPSPEAVKAMLRGLGVEDLTPYERS